MKMYYMIILLMFVTLVLTPNVFSQGPEYVVKVIYFLPNDRESDPDIDRKLNTLLKESQKFFADQMEAHGFGRKTFRLETDMTGKVTVHHVNGKFNDEYYKNPLTPRGSWIVWDEIDGHFDTSKNIYVLVLGISGGAIDGGNEWHGVVGRGSGNSLNGKVLVSASALSVTSHELGHAFGLQHDMRSNAKSIFASTSPTAVDTMLNSFGTAQWLNGHRYFNAIQKDFNADTGVEMLPPTLSDPPQTIRLRFKISDPDGLHQAQLFSPSDDSVIAYQGLIGKNATADFFTDELLGVNHITLRVMDTHGNFLTRSFSMPDITDLLSQELNTIVSIPDPILASGIRKHLKVPTQKAITRLDMLKLKVLVYNRIDGHVTNLTGLEYASNLNELSLIGHLIRDITPLARLSKLRVLKLSRNRINDNAPIPLDITPLTGLNMLVLTINGYTITDLTPLKDMTQLLYSEISLGQDSDIALTPFQDMTYLRRLRIKFEQNNDSVVDITPLSGLINLRELSISNGRIRDITPLAKLTRLYDLHLENNQISDVRPLAALTDLTILGLFNNKVGDITPLAKLTHLRELGLGNNQVSDITPLSGLRNLRALGLGGNLIADVSPLVDLPKLSGYEQIGFPGLYLERNPLNYASIHTHIPAIQAKGTKIVFDNRAHPAVVKISGDAQRGTAGEALPTPFVVEVQDQHGKPKQGVSVMFAITAGGGRLSTTTTTTNAAGRAQTRLTLGQTPGTNTVRATATGIASFVMFNIPATEGTTARIVGDVNGDGVVNVLDLITIVSHFDQTGPNSADVNGDGIVNLLDLVLVAGALEDGAAAAPTLQSLEFEGFTAGEIQDLLTEARQLALTDPIYLRGIMILEQLLIALIPKETALLTNYPNPFNPETWIPYQLEKPADVTLRIYAINGELIRTLALGHQPAGMYQTRSRAAYWDGRNSVGEAVASGIYFFTLSAGDFTATRKLLIRK